MAGGDQSCEEYCHVMCRVWGRQRNVAHTVYLATRVCCVCNFRPSPGHGVFLVQVYWGREKAYGIVELETILNNGNG